MRHHCLLLLSLVLVSYAARRSESALGGWSPIKDVNDSHVAEIANYAVSEYDKRSGAKLTLVKVSKGETQVGNNSTQQNKRNKQFDQLQTQIMKEEC